MRAAARVINPDSVTVEVTFVMTIQEMRALAEAIQPVTAWPASPFRLLLITIMQKTVGRIDSVQDAE